MKNLVKLKLVILVFSIIFASHSMAADRILPLPKPTVDKETKEKIAKKKEIYPQKKPIKEIEKIEVSTKGDVRRAKLYYLRDREGKSARISEKITKKIGVDIVAQTIENEIAKEDSKKENLIKDKDIATKAELKKEVLKEEKK